MNTYTVAIYQDFCEPDTHNIHTHLYAIHCKIYIKIKKYLKIYLKNSKHFEEFNI